MRTDGGRDRDAGAALRGSAWLTLNNVLGKSCHTIVTLVLAVLLDEREMGLTAYAAALVNIGVVLQTVGVHDVIARTRRGHRRMAGTVQSMSVLVAVGIAAVVAVGREPLSAALGAPDAGPLLALVVVGLPFLALSGAQVGLAHSRMQFRRRILPDLVNAAATTVVTITMAAGGHGAYALAFGIVVGAVLQPVVGVLVGIGVPFAWDRSCALEALGWIRVVGPAAVVATFLVNVDYLVVGATLGPAELGLYSMAFRVIWIPYVTVAIALAATSFPLYVRVLARDGDLTAAVREISHLAIVLIGGVYVALALLARHVVVLGRHWSPSAGVIVALAPYGFLLGVTLLWFEAVRAANRPGLYLALQLGHLVVTVALLLTLSPWGIVWAGVGQSLASVALAAPAFLAMRRSGVDLRIRSSARPLGVLVVGAALAGTVSTVLGSGLLPTSGSPVASLAIDATAVVAVYAAVVGLLDRRLVTTLRAVRSPHPPTEVRS